MDRRLFVLVGVLSIGAVGCRAGHTDVRAVGSRRNQAQGRKIRPRRSENTLFRFWVNITAKSITCQVEGNWGPRAARTRAARKRRRHLAWQPLSKRKKGVSGVRNHSLECKA